MIHPYMTTEKIDVLVIGAGPSGTVAASIINKAGFKTKIVEKEQFPRFVIGESLLPRCMEALDAADFVDVVKAKGFQVKYGAKFVQGTNKVMDFLFSEQFTKGWSWTWQVKRADFDYALAKEVERMGVPVEYKTTVTPDIQFSGSNSVTSVTKEDGTQKQIEAKFIVDASGYGRVIPRLFNLDKPSNLPPRKTLFTHIKDARRENYIQPNRILIIDHAPGVWAWVIPFSDGVSSCGFVGYPEYFDKYTGSPEEQLRAIIKAEPNTAKRFEDCEFMFEPRTIQGWSSTTNKFLWRWLCAYR
jgi:flavin-dependent dehydrogenase